MEQKRPILSLYGNSCQNLGGVKNCVTKKTQNKKMSESLIYTVLGKKGKQIFCKKRHLIKKAISVKKSVSSCWTFWVQFGNGNF